MQVADEDESEAILGNPNPMQHADTGQVATVQIQCSLLVVRAIEDGATNVSNTGSSGVGAAVRRAEEAQGKAIGGARITTQPRAVRPATVPALGTSQRVGLARAGAGGKTGLGAGEGAGEGSSVPQAGVGSSSQPTWQAMARIAGGSPAAPQATSRAGLGAGAGTGADAKGRATVRPPGPTPAQLHQPRTAAPPGMPPPAPLRQQFVQQPLTRQPPMQQQPLVAVVGRPTPPSLPRTGPARSSTAEPLQIPRLSGSLVSGHCIFLQTEVTESAQNVSFKPVV